MKKKLLPVIFALLCLLLFASAGCGMFGISCSPNSNGDKDDTPDKNKPEFLSGSGTESDPYIIDRDYQWLNVCKYPDAHFELSADINLGDYDSVAPTGTSQTPFTGSVDGKNHVISGANIRASHEIGLFGILSGAKVRNLTLSNSSVTMMSDYNDGEFMGSFAAVARKGTLIENCHSQNVNLTFPSKTGYFTFIGGFIGSLESVSSTIYCSCNVKITMSSGKYPGFYVGGFAEKISGSKIDCCKTTGSVTFGHPTGSYVMIVAAFVSRATNSEITNMLAEMNVNVGPTIDAYTIAGTVDEETLKYCLNFCSYQRAAKGRYRSCKVLTNASADVNIYFPPSEYAYANDTLDGSLWKENKFWKKGAIHPELVSYEEYLEIIARAQQE